MEIEKLPLRPTGNYINKFRKCDIISNHYKVNLKGIRCVYIYSTKFNQIIDTDNKRIKNKILQANIQILKQKIGYPTICGNNIYTLQSKFNLNTQEQMKLTYDGKQYHLIVKLVKIVNFKNFTSLNTQTYQSQQQKRQQKIGLSFLNNILRNFLRKLNFIQIGHSGKYFDPSTKTDVPHTSIQLFRGYTASFSFLQNGLYLKVDSTVKVVRGQTVLQFIQKLYDIHRDKTKDQKRAIVNEELRGKTIMANYGNSLYWRIQQIKFDITVQTYKIKDENQFNLCQYYKKKYNKDVKQRHQPLIKAKHDKKDTQVILIPEFCLMTGLPDNFDQQKRRQISQLTNTSAEERKRKIQDLLKRMNRQLISQISPKTISDNLGIKIQQNLTKISAKKIPVPSLALGDKYYVQQGKQFNFQLFDKPLYGTNKKIDCCCIYFSSYDSSSIQKLFKNTASSFKLELQMKCVNIGEFSFKSALDKIYDQIQYRMKKNIFNIYFLILPPPLKTSYKKLKNRCILNYKILTQISLQSTLKKNGFASIATKILLQMATKVGNVPWISKLSQRIQRKIMLIGIDTSTDKQLKQKKVIGFCASLNKDHSKFYSTTLLQDFNCNVNTKMKELLIQATSAYMKQNKCYPDQIIILRDGCGAGQIKVIMQFQLQQCKQTLKMIESHIGLCYIVIDKKVNEKFFGSNQGRISNPAAGTLINSEVVSSSSYDFYLISQYSNRGTVIPTYYKVLYNDSKLEQGKLQELIYCQCYNYMNWTGSIKIPAPIQYAKKLAAFVSQYINNEKSDKELSNSLYFI